MSNEPQIALSGLVSGLRPEVAEFAVAMELKLRKHDHKTGWKDQPIEAHIKLMDIERAEFEVALEFLTLEEACKELVDMANFGMIIRDKLRTQGKTAFRNRPLVFDGSQWTKEDMEALMQSNPGRVHIIHNGDK